MQRQALQKPLVLTPAHEEQPVPRVLCASGAVGTPSCIPKRRPRQRSSNLSHLTKLTWGPRPEEASKALSLHTSLAQVRMQTANSDPRIGVQQQSEGGLRALAEPGPRGGGRWTCHGNARVPPCPGTEAPLPFPGLHSVGASASGRGAADGGLRGTPTSPRHPARFSPPGLGSCVPGPRAPGRV